MDFKKAFTLEYELEKDINNNYDKKNFKYISASTLKSSLKNYLLKLDEFYLLDKIINENYSSSQEEQIHALKENYFNCQLVLVLGTGISKKYCIPDWNTLLNKILLRLLRNERNNNSTRIDAILSNIDVLSSRIFENVFNSNPLITARCLKELSKKLNSKSFDMIIKESLYEFVDKTVETETMKEIVQLCIAPGKLPTLDSIITYNYDDILENAINKIGIDFKYSSIYKEGLQVQNDELAIYHVHGYLPYDKNLENSSLILDESKYHEQYNAPYSWNNMVQINKFTDKCCLFIGTSFKDPNLRRLLDISIRNNNNTKPKHYLIRKKVNKKVATNKIKKTFEKRKDTLENDVFSTTNIDDVADKIITLNQRLEEIDAKSFSTEIIWINDYERDIPYILRQLRIKN